MNSWSVYLIYNKTHNRTYIGATTDVIRRVRQHRGELVGGAKSTTKLGSDWVPVCALTGFKSRSEAYRWEKLLKSRCTGFEGRIIGFTRVAAGICPTARKKGKDYAVPQGLDFSSFLDPGMQLTKDAKVSKG